MNLLQLLAAVRLHAGGREEQHDRGDRLAGGPPLAQTSERELGQEQEKGGHVHRGGGTGRAVKPVLRVGILHVVQRVGGRDEALQRRRDGSGSARVPARRLADEEGQQSPGKTLLTCQQLAPSGQRSARLPAGGEVAPVLVEQAAQLRPGLLGEDDYGHRKAIETPCKRSGLACRHQSAA